jgi:hypothetical protein
MKFKKAYYKISKYDYNILATYTIIFDPYQDVFQTSEDTNKIKYKCCYYGRQCNDDDPGKPVAWDELPAPVKKQIATIQASSFF